VTVHIRTGADIDAFNEVYRELMPQPLPARSSAFVELRLADMLVEMEAIAVIPDER